MNVRTALAACAAVLAMMSAALAQLQNENLLVTLPEGYKVDFHEKKQNSLISEMVPAKESVKDWTEMVTVQIFYRSKQTPEQFKGRLEKLWSDACEKSVAKNIAQGVENGYPFVLWLQSCPLNKQGGKPEITWFKAIQGNDSFYVVQKAFKFAPSQVQIVQWTLYLKSVGVCDSRLPDRACPKTKP